jgi:very-short-patch-repair endonuclease
MENHSPYKKSKNLLTKTEADFYVYLKAAVNNDFHINKMTRMCDLVDVDKRLRSKEYMSYFRSISQYHIDFTLCDPFSFKPVVCIELDDPSHERAGRIKRDKKVNKIFADINLPLLRIKTERKYSVENLRKIIDSSIKDASEKQFNHENNSSADEDTFDINIDRDDWPRKYEDKISKQKKESLISSGTLLIFAIIFILVAIQKIAHKPGATVRNIPKRGTESQIKPDNSKSRTNPSGLELSQKRIQQTPAPDTNEYTIKDVTITSPARIQSAKVAIPTENNDVKIKPNHYVGNFTVEMVWEGNYKSGDGIIALLDCGAQWLLIEQLASGIQLEHTVEKLTKETHTELLPTTNSSSSYYLITSYGSLQKWDRSGKVNEFRRRT